MWVEIIESHRKVKVCTLYVCIIVKVYLNAPSVFPHVLPPQTQRLIKNNQRLTLISVSAPALRLFCISFLWNGSNPKGVLRCRRISLTNSSLSRFPTSTANPSNQEGRRQEKKWQFGWYIPQCCPPPSRIGSCGTATTLNGII